MTLMLPEDIFFVLCGELSARKDFDSLLSCALCSRSFAQTALSWLYRTYHDSPLKGGGSEALAIPQQELVVQKWSIMWRSIIASSLGSVYTYTPYSRYIRVLDLRDLAHLLEDNKFRGKIASYFFAEPLERFNVPLDTPSKPTRSRAVRPARLNVVAIINAIGETVTKSTPMLEQIAGNVVSEALGTWASSLRHLRSLELWDGKALECEETRRMIQTHCPQFSSLSIYQWAGSREDADRKLADFISGLAPESLVFFEVISNAGVGPQTCSALNSHGKSLRELRLNLSSEALPHLALLKRCTSIRALQLGEMAGRTDLDGTQHDAFEEMIAWLRECRSLHTLTFNNFLSGPSLVAPLLQGSSMQLRKLELDSYRLRERADLHLALSTQTQLQSLFLRGDSDEAQQADIDIFVDSLCHLKSLRALELKGVSDGFSDAEIIGIAKNLPGLEDLYVSGLGVTDAVLEFVGQLKNLRTVTFYAYTSFTVHGLCSFISQLGPGNDGIVLSVDMAEPETGLDEREQLMVREQLAAKVGGRFEYTLLRDPDVSEFEGESD